MDWNLLGHEWAVSLLAEHVARQNMRHAYLLTGPHGVGRRTLALRFAQALNCTQPLSAGKPCQECRICRQIHKMQHPDLAIVQAEQQGGILKVDQVRELQRSLALAPYEARYRVALLLRFEEANPSAQNALLKTLEEPAPQVILILTAESAESLLPTIVSRCEILRLRPLPLEQVSQGLQDLWGLPGEQARLLAHISGGRPGYALRLHQQPTSSSEESLEQRIAWLDEHWRLLAASRGQRFRSAEALAGDKDTLRTMLLWWLSLWRDVLLRATGSSAAPTNIDRLEEIDQLATRLGAPAAYDFISALKRSLELLQHNANIRLVMEVLMLDLPKVRL